ncbi:Wzz/FepE/Etk N-terminal domain-containing protein [Litorivivens sp.]|uniref:Wzz/FepE/Etk N-terminal domain-containing protein n=1 Tax=Litorivivens sp. TaxID=2020868 RepID=UPI003566F4AE
MEEQTKPQTEPNALPPALYGPDEDEIDLFELWDIVWAGKWWVILCVFIGAGTGVTHALLAPEIYEATVVMMPAKDEGGSGGLSSLVGQFGGLAALAGVNVGGGGGNVEEAKTVLRSYAFVSRFLETQKLMDHLYPPEQRKAENPPSVQQAVKQFTRSVLSVSDDKKSGAVSLTIAWTDPDLAAQWANALVAMLNMEMREQDVGEAKRAIAFLHKKLEETSVVEMQQTLYRLIEAQTKTVMLANVRDDYVFRIIDPAYAPEIRSKPKRSLIAVLGTMLGGFAGLLIVFGRRVVLSYRQRK